MRRVKYVLMSVVAVAALGLAMHRGLTQSPPTVVGPGFAPNVGTPVNPYSLSYYGGWYGGPSPLYNYAQSVYNVTFGPEDIPQTSNSISTKEVGNSVTFEWQGQPQAVKSITFALLDKHNAVVSSHTITALPARAALKKTVKTTGYSVNIVYINGLTNTISSPL